MWYSSFCHFCFLGACETLCEMELFEQFPWSIDFRNCLFLLFSRAYSDSRRLLTQVRSFFSSRYRRGKDNIHSFESLYLQYIKSAGYGKNFDASRSRPGVRRVPACGPVPVWQTAAIPPGRSWYCFWFQVSERNELTGSSFFSPECFVAKSWKNGPIICRCSI